MANNLHIFFAEVRNLSPIEGFISERADWLEDKVNTDNIWTTPIVADNRNGLIMDGHHRFEVAKRLKLLVVPVIPWSYSEVEVYSLRDDEKVSVERIRENFSNGHLYPNKTAKHRFPFILPENLEIPLEKLK